MMQLLVHSGELTEEESQRDSDREGQDGLPASEKFFLSLVIKF